MEITLESGGQLIDMLQTFSWQPPQQELQPPCPIYKPDVGLNVCQWYLILPRIIKKKHMVSNITEDLSSAS